MGARQRSAPAWRRCDVPPRRRKPLAHRRAQPMRAFENSARRTKICRMLEDTADHCTCRAAQRAARHAAAAALARDHRPDHGGAGGRLRDRFSAADLGVPGGRSRCRPGSTWRCGCVFRLTQRLEPERAAWLLAFDIAELAVLLFLTGGLENPFAFLFLAPVLLSATALPPRITVMLGAFAVLCATVLVFVHYPLPWDADDPLELPLDLSAGRLDFDPARDRIHRGLCVADHRGGPPARRGVDRDRARAVARAAPVAARRACGRRRP